MAQDRRYALPTYTPTARALHWLIAFLVFIQLPLGLYMSYRGNEMITVNEKGETVKGIFDALTGVLYSSHKLIGLTIFLLIVVRLLYRLTQGAPRPDPSVPAALTGVSHLVHWMLYLLLIAVPIAGYLAISYGRYLEVFGIPLPAHHRKEHGYVERDFRMARDGRVPDPRLRHPAYSRGDLP